MNPFDILGVSPSDDEETIKKAYRALSKKYHPDNNPGSRTAEEQFKAVQAAYEQIMDMRRNGYSGYRDPGGRDDYSSFFGFNAGGSNANDRYRSDLLRAEELLKVGSYREAVNVLNGIPQRNGDWYYLSAFAHYQLGENAIALDDAKKAYSIDPNNPYYGDLLDKIQGSAFRYNDRYESYDHSNSVSDTCCKIILCNMGLNMCCGGPRC